MKNQKKKPVDAIEKTVEVENIRLSNEYKEGIISKYVNKKFKDKINVAELAVSKCLEIEHRILFPELNKFDDSILSKWVESSGYFRVFGVRTNCGHRDINIQTYFPRPRSWNYRFEIKIPSVRTVSTIHLLMDLELEKESFSNNLKKVLDAVRTSKQLCEIIPELAELFPKRITGSPCVSLVPIELIRSVRDSLRIESK